MEHPRDRRTALPAAAQSIQVAEHASGYFSAPTPGLDPKLFEPDSTHLRPDVRAHTIQTLYGFWRGRYREPERWSVIWFAGSGVSYQWSAARDPGDLDTLVGVDFPRFLLYNPQYQGMQDQEIADMMNDEFRNGLDVQTANWEGFEQTWYVNATADDIRNINPYAAYDVTHDEWTVDPISLPSTWDPTRDFPASYWQEVNDEHERALAIIEQYNWASNSGSINSSYAATQAARMAKDLFDSIHLDRKKAFRRTGQGYLDYFNFRWQVHKKRGIVPALRAIAGTLENPNAPLSAEQALRLAVQHVREY